MSLRRVLLALCCALVSASASAASVDDWVAGIQADKEQSFQECLKAFEEKPLEPLAQDRSVEIYRMVYLPSFYPQVSMRVNVWPDGGGRLTVRSVPPYCGFRDPPIEQKQVDVPASEVAELRDVYARADFWARVKVEGRGGADGIEAVTCSDGASVYFEAVRDGRHHRISRTCLWIEAIEDMKVVFHRLARMKDPHRTD